jgi:hypothetical protein
VDPDLRLVRFPRIFCKRHMTPCGGGRPACKRSSVFGWPCSFMRNRPWPTMRPHSASACPLARCNDGDSAGRQEISRSRIAPGGAASPLFPPLDQALVRALACETVAQTGLPLSRQSLADLASRAAKTLGKSISRSTVWRVLHEDALKPWQYEHWIFPRDPAFAAKAGPILDLYAGHWEGRPLGERDCVISSDEKTSIQARGRCHAEMPPRPRQARRIETEYERHGALQYLAGWDVRRGVVLGRCEAKTGIRPFGRLVTQILNHDWYRNAERIFLIVDNGSSHRGARAVRRQRKRDRRLILVHTPVHASWLNQVEVYFSIIQRKVLTPNDFPSLDAIRLRLSLYEELTNRCPRPFEWKFTRQKLANWLQRAAPHFVAEPAA